MASNARFDVASSSPEGSTFTANYQNGQRGAFSVPVDRSGSFHESIEGRVMNSGSNVTRGGMLPHSEMPPPLSQCLPLEPLSMGEQKFSRQGELKRVLSVSLGITSEDSSFGAAHNKPMSAAAIEELKRFKSCILENTSKAREKAKFFGNCLSKLDKYQHTIFSRKRLRNENSLNERSCTLLPGDRSVSSANLMKMGTQGHQTPSNSELTSPRSEDRSKNVLNKRVRTSMVDVRTEGRGAGLSRPAGSTDREKDALRSANVSGSEHSEEKARVLLTGGESWDKKMKRRRSAIKPEVSTAAVVNRSLEADRELKKGLQQRLNNETRSRLSDVHGFSDSRRSGSSNGIVGTNKLDGTAQTSVMSVRAAPKNDLDNSNLSNERRDRMAGADKERVIVKAANKANIRDDSSAGSPTPVTKGKGSRAPRSNAGALNSSSPNFPRASGALEGWEQPSSTSKVQAISAANNRKRPMPARSPSPVTQWARQRPQKMSRIARRSNLVPPVSIRDDSQISSEGFAASDVGTTRVASMEATGPGVGRRASNSAQQAKLKFDVISSPAGISESEESGAAENKLRKKNGEMEDKALNKVSTIALSSKKNKILSKEDSGDGVRRLGRSGRGVAPSRTGPSLMREKFENTVSMNQLKSTRPGSDRIESKTGSGRPPSKKYSDRKAFTRPKDVLNSGSSEFAGESDDDHEELLAAADSAINADRACSSPFWKQMEPIFAFVTADDLAYLKYQIKLVDEFDGSVCNPLVPDQIGKDANGCTVNPSSPALSSGDKQVVLHNEVCPNESGRTGSSVDESLDFEALPKKLGRDRWLEKMIPLSQRLIAALIHEDDLEEYNPPCRQDDEPFQYTSDDSPCGTGSHIESESKDADKMESEIESEADLKNQRPHSLDSFSCDGSTASNCFRSPNFRSHLNNGDSLQDDDIVVHSEIGIVTENHLDDLQCIQTVISGTSSNESQYQQLCLNSRILLELQSIGLFPESVPDLAQGEDEIDKDIFERKEEIYQQVRKKKNQLCKLERTVLKRREVEERDRERLAMDKLVEMAYCKHMGCRANASGNKSGASKIAKHAALAFAKRTLARCRKYEDTGRSCFSEPAFRDGILFPPLLGNDATYLGDGNPANLDTEALAAGLMPSGHVTRLVEPRDNIEKDSPDSFQALVTSSGEPFAKDEPWSNRGKRREVFLDDVGCASTPRATPSLCDSLMGGAKGKRSERDRDHKDISTRSGTAKSGRPSLGSVRGERKTKTKPRQKTAQLSASVNGLLGKIQEDPKGTSPALPQSSEKDGNKAKGLVASSRLGNHASNLPHDTEGAIDLTHLQLPGMEELGVADDLGAQGQDLSSWFNFDDEGLQDHDFMGLEIPMDDLSELNMIM
ncbi:uncharacterized protein LOC18444914 isoform X2 [Amborella trichopoda]|uniref:uncharacterized protein LOC18444914 isoform X2 n=1 Tax=Amborella trichopoda TaxID=13333 RepID=UPI0009BDF65D|nr:uncharacterized protein LOC18444914 isoform X2 [Amborella trichopoda]|eukprot:XP_020529611.1 uncharacterized protein LOC18444914 isoform X2 [Amborella trichopoda]